MMEVVVEDEISRDKSKKACGQLRLNAMTVTGRLTSRTHELTVRLKKGHSWLCQS